MFYEPTFTISPEMQHMAFRIIEKLVRIERYGTLESNPRLKKQDVIRAIHSSCSIEGNSLTLGQVTDLINGHRVLGPERDVREVQNAYAAYTLLESFDPCDLNEMLRIHGILTEELVEESGRFRSGEEGVFSGNICIYVAPPPEKVPGMMADLFGWLNGSYDTVGLLIASCVFHYGLVFIHPFADGNGRIARLWQKALLAKWRPVFRWIPIETRIKMAQKVNILDILI